MKIISWNVNGIRAVLKKGFHNFLLQHDPDILCLQETKYGKDPIQLLLPQYKQYWLPAKRPGYSGTAVFTKFEPLSIQYEIAHEDHDGEGRVISLEFENYFLVNVYVPNARRDLMRLKYRQKWDADFLLFLKKLEEKKPVIICGDMNVAHNEIDLARPKQNKKNAGFTPEERAGFQAYIDTGFLDTFRLLNQEPDHYTWWSYMNNARPRNIGWRIDYFLISPALRSTLQDAFILPQIMGSDHCPVGIVLKKNH